MLKPACPVFSFTQKPHLVPASNSSLLPHLPCEPAIPSPLAWESVDTTWRLSGPWPSTGSGLLWLPCWSSVSFPEPCCCSPSCVTGTPLGDTPSSLPGVAGSRSACSSLGPSWGTQDDSFVLERTDKGTLQLPNWGQGFIFLCVFTVPTRD